jgi:signal transduction histidine kinase
MIEEKSLNKSDIEKFSEYLDLIEKETRRTSKIVTNLLAFSRQSKMEFGRVNLNRLIEQTLVLNSNLLRLNKIQVETELDKNMPDLIGSEDQLQQVFMNLVSNAAESMELTDGAVLSITTQHSLKSNRFQISFKDTGVGVPNDSLSNLFEPFFTTKKGKGVGLGLSVVYGIIQEHGGSIDVISEEGKGTTFEIELPMKNKTEKISE